RSNAFWGRPASGSKKSARARRTNRSFRVSESMVGLRITSAPALRPPCPASGPCPPGPGSPGRSGRPERPATPAGRRGHDGSLRPARRYGQPAPRHGQARSGAARQTVHDHEQERAMSKRLDELKAELGKVFGRLDKWRSRCKEQNASTEAEKIKLAEEVL